MILELPAYRDKTLVEVKASLKSSTPLRLMKNVIFSIIASSFGRSSLRERYMTCTF